MSNLERGFCPVEEYTASEESRYREGDLMIDGLYLMMFSLKSRDSGQQAAKIPARVTDIEAGDEGLCRVGMTILNADLHPDCETAATFVDGYWQSQKSRRLSVGGNKVRIAYLKSYYGGMDDELETIIRESLPGPVLFDRELEPVTA